MMCKHFRQTIVAAALMLCTSPAFAQRGGFSPEGMFERFDADGSGVLEPQEIENSPLRFMADRMGLDTSRGISRDEMAESMDNMRRSFEERGGSGDRGGFGRGGFDGGFGGPPGDFGGGFWGRGGDGDRGSSRDRSDRDREDRRRDDRGDSRSRGTTAVKVEPPPRVTFDLPEAYVPGDADRDGQIGLYEWTKWKSRAALAEFLGLDRDGDGFLTPRELAQAADAKPVDVATLYRLGPQVGDVAFLADTTSPATATVENVAASTKAAAPTTDPADTKAVIAVADQGQVKQAERLFSVLDRNADGTISEEEWSASRKLKPRFEQAGADLARPMSSDQFVSYYVRIIAADGSI